jgi:polysaccharide biosynthesis transport protein
MSAPQTYTTVSRRPPDIEDYIDILRRHKAWIIGPAWAGLVIAVIVAFLWPNTYESVATLRIVPQTVPEQFVPSAMNLQLAQRLDGLRTQILSRSNLGSLITTDRFRLYPRTVQRYSVEDAVDEMQHDIQTPALDIQPDPRRPATAFQIRYSYPDRYKAQAVVQELVTQFINQNTVLQRKTATATQGFLVEELDSAKANYENLLANIAKFRAENRGQLPEDAMVNASQLNSLQMQIAQANERLNRAQQQKNSLQTDLQNRIDMRAIVVRNLDEGTAMQTVKNQNLVNLETQIRTAEANLAAMREMYTDDWVNVRQQKALLASLEKQKAAELARQAKEEAAAANGPPKDLTAQQQATLRTVDGAIDSLRTSIKNVQLDIDGSNAERQGLEKAVQQVNAKLAANPIVQEQYANLSKDLDLAKQHYDDLVRKQQMAETAKSLEDRGAGETLELMDPPSLPQAPSNPNRWRIAVMGSGMGLIFGLVMAGAREAKDTSLKNLKDVRAYTSLPVLSSVPLLENALLIRRKRRLFWVAWGAALIVGALAMGAAILYYFLPQSH